MTTSVAREESVELHGPSDSWQVVALGDVCDMRNGMNVRQDKLGIGLPISRIETISAGVIDGTRVGFAGLQASSCAAWLLQRGDILFSHINSVEHLGKCALYRGSPDPLVHGMNLLRLRCDHARLLPEFLVFVLRSAEFRKGVLRHTKEAINQASVSIGDLRTLSIPLPPLAEQERIAGRLTEQLAAVERARGAAQSRLAAAESLPAAYLREVFEGPEASGEARRDAEWPTVRLDDVATTSSGGTPPRSRPDYYKGTVPWAKIEDLTRNGMWLRETEEHITEAATHETNAKVFPARTVLVAMYGSIGTTSIAALPVSCNQAILGCECGPDLHPEYLFYWFSLVRRLLLARGRGGTQANLNAGIVNALSIPLPPLAEQERIAADLAARLAGAERLAEGIRAELAAIEALPAALLREAFGGSPAPGDGEEG
jgi:type I restriction enzyme S subunit